MIIVIDGTAYSGFMNFGFGKGLKDHELVAKVLQFCNAMNIASCQDLLRKNSKIKLTLLNFWINFKNSNLLNSIA